MTLNEKIEKSVEEFDKEFCIKANLPRWIFGSHLKEDLNDKDIKSFLRTAQIELLEEARKQIEELIVAEILICHHENTPTSRLTSLMMKIKSLFNQNDHN